MRNNYFIGKICLMILLIAFTSCNTIKRGFRIANAGLSGPVYRTDADLIINKVRAKTLASDTAFILESGLKYRIVDIDKGVTFIKMIPVVGYYKNSVSNGEVYIRVKPETPLATFREIPKNELYSVPESKLLTYNKVIVNHVALGTMLLPIKIRRPTKFNDIKYRRQFSTDISVGPYIGYRFKLRGNNYKTHTTIGLFAGPTLIDYVSSTSQSGSPLNGVNPDNMFAFTSGLGLVHEIEGFQVGVVYGADWVSGNRVDEWPYDGKGWFSLAIGYNFLAGRQ